MPAEDVTALASLPSKDQLIGQVVDMLLSPVNDVTNGLSGNLHALLDGVEAKASA
jgi:large subunit ribosomal protein L10